MNRISACSLTVITFWAIILLAACQSDGPADKSTDKGLFESDEGAGTTDDASAAGFDEKKLEKIMAQLQDLKKAHEELEEKRINLQKQYDAIPAEVKKNAVNCDQLEAQFEGHFEKSKMRINDLERLMTDLKNRALRENEEVIQGYSQEERNVSLDVLMMEYRNDIPQIEAEFQNMAKAIEQLKASIPKQGKGVVLFE